MFLRWLLFETKVGEVLVCFLEKKAGLALVQAEWLGAQPSGMPRVASGEQRGGLAGADDSSATS